MPGWAASRTSVRVPGRPAVQVDQAAEFSDLMITRNGGGPLVTWTVSRLPITPSVAAAGAAMVSLIGHAGDEWPRPATSWLLAGAVALGLVALTFTEQALADASASTPSTGRSASRWRPARPRRSSPARLDPHPGCSGCLGCHPLGALGLHRRALPAPSGLDRLDRRHETTA